MPLGNITTDDLEQLMDAILQSGYHRMKSVTALVTVRTLCEQLQRNIDIYRAKPASSDPLPHELNGLAKQRIAKRLSRLVGFHWKAINKRIAQIERANEFRAKQARQDRVHMRLGALLADTGILTDISNASAADKKAIAALSIENVKLEHARVVSPLVEELNARRAIAEESSKAYSDQGDEISQLLSNYQSDKQTLEDENSGEACATQPINSDQESNTHD